MCPARQACVPSIKKSVDELIGMKTTFPRVYMNNAVQQDV